MNLKEAIKKDFHELYSKGYCMDWEAKRLIRDSKIDIMEFDHLKKAIRESEELKCK